MSENELFRTVLVHTARTWERIRIQQPYEEMPSDNIASVDSIVEIAERILENKVLQKFLNSGDDWDWEEESGESFSDSFIESLAGKIITEEYL